jgi:hypothetical protein
VQGESFVADQFYYVHRTGSPIDQQLLAEYTTWERCCTLLVYEATAAVNWLSDVVRRDLNSRFFLLDGRFSLREATFPSLTYGVNLYQYDGETRPENPEAVDRRIAEIVAPYRTLVKDHAELRASDRSLGSEITSEG